MGLALSNFAGAYGYIPPGMLTELDIQDSFHTGFTYLLPYLEQDAVNNQYQYDKQWYDPANYTAVGQQIAVFLCPSNRTRGQIDMTPYIQQWSCPMPPVVGTTDYILCKGANAGLSADPTKISLRVRGLFNITQANYQANGIQPVNWLPTPEFQVKLTDIADGLSNTIAIGEGAGGNPLFPVADLSNPGQPVIEPFVNGPALMDQGWATASLGDPSHPWYAGIFGVTAQFGLAPNPNDEPMNLSPGTPTIIGSDSSGYNVTGRDHVSGFRSAHGNGCHFLFADGSVHWISQSIDPDPYRALSTYAGTDSLAGYNDY